MIDPTTNLPTKADEQLHAAAERLLEAAMAYWKEHARVTGGTGVVWLKDVDGRMVILTRGEYRDRLTANIDRLELDGTAEHIIPFGSKPKPG